MENSLNNMDDEITLLDIFSVIIKYRKFIIISMLILIVLTSIFVFCFTKHKVSVDTYTIEYTIPFMNNEHLYNLLHFNLSSDLILQFSNLNTLANLNKKIPIFYYDFDSSKFDENDYNYFIKKQQTESHFSVSVNDNVSTILLKIKTSNKENVDNFVISLVETINNHYDLILQQLIANRLLTLNSLIESEITNFDKTDIINEYVNLQDLKKNNIRVLDTNTDSFIFRESKFSYLFFIIFFACFFVSVFLAFLLNAINNIKADTVVAEKIKSAWENGKKIFP